MITKGSNPTSDTAKAAEIMSRYRPIAPRPEGPANSSSVSHNSERIEQSPYLRSVWPSLQARPTRTRKRGRTSLPPPPPPIRRTHLFAAAGSMHGFVHRHLLLPSDFTTTTLPLLPCPLSSLPVITHQPPPPSPLEYSCDWEGGDNEGIDLNRSAAADQVIIRIPEEKDLLKQLSQRPLATNNAIVITPQPIRPIGSSVNVKCINDDLLGCCSRSSALSTNHAPKKRKEVEEEVDSEALPAVVSDSNHRVWLANSAYKEMVGQPECLWLDAMATCKRICGEVVLRFADKCVPVPLDSNGFSCWVTIDWGRNGEKSSVHAFCDVMRLSCESKDYLFAWRFHTGEASRSGSKA